MIAIKRRRRIAVVKSNANCSIEFSSSLFLLVFKRMFCMVSEHEGLIVSPIGGAFPKLPSWRSCFENVCKISAEIEFQLNRYLLIAEVRQISIFVQSFTDISG